MRILVARLGVLTAACAPMAACSSFQALKDSAAPAPMPEPPALSSPILPPGEAHARAEAALLRAGRPAFRAPGRVGVALAAGDGLTDLSPHELGVWRDFATRLGPEFLTIGAVSPAGADIASDVLRAKPEAIVSLARRAGALQNFDYVILLEASSQTRTGPNVGSALDWTGVIPALAPSVDINAAARVRGIWIEVESGSVLATEIGSARRRTQEKRASLERGQRRLADGAELAAMGDLSVRLELAAKEFARDSQRR